jgi:hypothetical protein
MAAVMFFAAGWGYARLLQLPLTQGRTSALPAGGGSLLGTGSALPALAAVAGTALLAALLIMVRRLSPLATGLPGALLLAWTVLYLVSVRQAVALIPLRSRSFGAGWEALLFHGILGAAGVALIAPALIPRRWQRWQQPQAAGTNARALPAGGPANQLYADERLHEVWPDARPWQADARRPEEEPALSGTVLPYPAAGSVRPVDTTRITGASRALRATGSFKAASGRAPRSTDWFGAVPDNTLRGRPYYKSPQE